MRLRPVCAILVALALPVASCGADDDPSTADPPVDSMIADEAADPPIPSDPTTPDGDVAPQPEIEESASVTIGGEVFALEVGECDLREDSPRAVTSFPNRDNELFGFTLNTEDGQPFIKVDSVVDDPDVPAFAADQASYKGTVSDLEFSSSDGASTFSGSNLTIADEGTGEPLTIESFTVTCEASDF